MGMKSSNDKMRGVVSVVSVVGEYDTAVVHSAAATFVLAVAAAITEVTMGR